MDLIDNLITYLTNPNPTADEAQAAFEPLTNGDYSDIHIAALLATLKARGETAADITGAARAGCVLPVGGGQPKFKSIFATPKRTASNAFSAIFSSSLPKS